MFVQVVEPSAEQLVTPENLQAFAELALAAAKSGNVAMLLSLALVLVVWAIRKFLGPKIPFLNTQLGGALVTLVGAFGAALATTLAGGGVFSWAIALGALKVAFTAAGGWTLIKHLTTAFKPVDPVAIKNAAEAEGAKAVEVAIADGKVVSIEEAIRGHLEESEKK